MTTSATLCCASHSADRECLVCVRVRVVDGARSEDLRRRFVKAELELFKTRYAYDDGLEKKDFGQCAIRSDGVL